MRSLFFLPLLALAAACASPDAPTPSGGSASPEPGTITRLTVGVDSLVERDPALNLDVAIGYPQVRGSDEAVIARINRAVRDSVEAFAAGLRPDPADFTGDPETDRMIVAEAQGGMARAFVGDGVFSSRVEVYFYTGGAHGMTVALPFTYDLRTGAAIGLTDLFRPNVAYADTLAALATERFAAERGTDWMFEDAVPPDAIGTFTLGTDSLTLFFPNYAIAPYAAGTSEASISYTALRGLLAPSGAVVRLTGGD